jgi:hypothetical protein
MMISTGRPRAGSLWFLPLVLVALIVSGCAGSKIAPDLLANVEVNSEPLVSNAAVVAVTINPDINNHEKIDESVKASLGLALQNAKVFGADASRPYRIDANVVQASQAAMSFGSFEGKLKIRYVVSDDGNNKIVDEEIYTVAGSDHMYFSGAKRHRRARAVNISKNVLQFVGVLQGKLKK